MFNFEQIDSNFNFPNNENDVLKIWQDTKIYDKIVKKNRKGPVYNYVDGPPFVSSSLLHFGHVHIGMMKSVLVNYLNMNGYNVSNKIGYDCHGLPIEQVVSSMLNLNGNNEIRAYGIDKYNSKCEEVIDNFSNSWKPIYDRIGRFVDYDNQYKTMDFKFMESCWWCFKQIWNKDLVYRGYRVMPYSTGCGTSLSTSEVGQETYKNVRDMSVYVKFQLKAQYNTYMVAWTTTPWTLPSNLALAVNPNMEYVKVLDAKTNEYYIIAKDCIKNMYEPSNPKKTDGLYKIVDTYKGIELNNLEYVPVFPYFNNRTFKVLMGEFVTNVNGTGMVHIAPAFGQDDFDICINNNIVSIDEIGNYCPVDEDGKFTFPITEYLGEHVLSTNKKIIDRLKTEGSHIKTKEYDHSYPHCPRTKQPIIYKAVTGFFIKVSVLREQMLKNNEKINWIPDHIKRKRFRLWLEGARDWGISRSRFFGTPIPVWISDDGQEMICVGSAKELAELANLDYVPENLHPQYLQHIQIPSKNGKGMLKLSMEIFDCWFESGCVPMGQLHYPFENSDAFDNKETLCDFISEGLDQTRGWFYTLTVISTILFDKPAFKNVICNGLILAESGQKFSKRDNNFVSPIGVCDEYGADALRLYLIGSHAANGESFSFNANHIKEINAKYFQWLNALRFFIEHITKFQKDGNVFDINEYINSDNIMDKWIISRVKTLLLNIRNNMSNYTFYKIKAEIMDFIEELTNWYIKLNRNRLRGRFCKVTEQMQALSTLYYVLLSFTKISAPFVPFLTEKMYQTLKQALPEQEQQMSVHLCDYPNANNFAEDVSVERSMKYLQNVICCIRTLRMKTSTCAGAKVPLKKVIIVNKDNDYLNDLKIFERYLCEEVNTLSVEYKNTQGKESYIVIPNMKELGKKYRGETKLLIAELNSLGENSAMYANLIDYMENKHDGLKVLDKVLFEPEFEVKNVCNLDLEKNQMGEMANGVGIIIDTTQDHEVTMVKFMRLIVTTIQNMRKRTNLRPWDKIGIYYHSDNEFITDVVNDKYDIITQELIYPMHKLDGDIEMKGTEIIREECDILGLKVTIIITDQFTNQ